MQLCRATEYHTEDPDTLIAGGAMSDEYALQHAPFEACQRSTCFFVFLFCFCVRVTVEQSIVMPWSGNL